MALLPSVVFGSSAGTDLSETTEEYQEHSKLASIEKTLPWCDAEGKSCEGTFGDLIDHFFTERSGKVKAYVSDFLNQAISAGTTCILEQDYFVEIRAVGGDKTVLEQLYLTKLSGDVFWLRLKSSDGTPSGLCQISYIRTLYTP